jgi:hypothetical protein
MNSSIGSFEMPVTVTGVCTGPAGSSDTSALFLQEAKKKRIIIK